MSTTKQEIPCTMHLQRHWSSIGSAREKDRISAPGGAIDQNAKKREYRRERTKLLRSVGLCSDCGKQFTGEKYRCTACAARRNELARQRYRSRK